MIKSEAHKHLELCTVKIESDYNVGSGFFIKQGLIVTCYHVVEDCSSKQLTVTWQEKTYKALKIESNPNDDLAIITLKIDKNHPHVQLESTINPDDRCSFYGFPENHRKNGIIRNCKHEGATKKLLIFSEEQFEYGFSGSAILNFETGKVCGVVNKSCDPYSKSGGYAIPLTTLIRFLESQNYEIDDNGSIFSKEMFKNWVWTSSVESADRLQFSVLALVETLVAVSVSFYVWIYYGFYWHIITGLVIAPLFFLRSRKSERDAIALFLKKIKIEKRDNESFFLIILLSFSLFKLYGNTCVGLILCNLYIIFFLLIISIIYISIYLLSNIKFLKKIVTSILITLILFVWIDNHLKLGVLEYRSEEHSWPLAMLGASITFLISFWRLTIYSFLIKFYITIKYLALESIFYIPKNWFKLILSTDIVHPVEILPSIEKSKISFSLIKYGTIKVSFLFSKKKFYSKFDNLDKFMDFNYKRDFLKNNNFFISKINNILNIIYQYTVILFKNLFTLLVNIITIIFITAGYIYIEILFVGLNFIFAIIFRYSLKSTAWIYLPLIWLIQPQDKETLDEKLEEESKIPKAYIMFLYSLVVVFVFTLFPLIFPYIEMGNYLQNSVLPRELKTIFFAYQENFGIWHVTRFFSAMITIIFMFTFPTILIKRRKDPSYGDFWGAKLLSLRALRGVLTLVTLGFTAYHILGLLPDNFFGDLWGNMRFTR